MNDHRDHEYDHDYHRLSVDLSAMTLSDEDHHRHHQPNNINNSNVPRIRGRNVVDSNSNHNINNMPDFYETHAYNNNNNNTVEDETVTATYPRYQNNMGSPKSLFGVSSLSDIKWGMQKGNTFAGVSQMGSSLDLGNGNTVSYGHYYGHGRGRVVPVQLQNSSYNNPYEQQQQQRIVYPSPPTRSSFAAMENDFPSNPINPIMYASPNVNNAPSSALYYPSNSHFQLPQSPYPTRPIEEPLAFKCDNSFILQERDWNSFLGGAGAGAASKYSYSQGVVIPQTSHHFPVRTENTRAAIVADDDNDVQQPLMNFGYLPALQSYMIQTAKDQNGGRQLQKLVEEGSVDDKEMVFTGVIENIVELMMDPFGNYLVQKLLEFCREDQRLQIVHMLTKEPGQLVRTSLNTHGTRVVQVLISTIKSRRQIALVRAAIQPAFLELVKDLNGNHVIQRCLTCFSVQDNEFIFDAATKFCLDVATHQHGCCVLQRCIDYSKGKSQERLVKEICKHGFHLAQDPYGNYVVQYIIQMQIPSAIAKFTAQFRGNYVTLSTQKFSSHVVEKCLKYIPETRARIVQELLSIPRFECLLQDPFGNYVLQCALDNTKGSLLTSLVDAVRAHKNLRTSPYCKRTFSKIQLKK
ncbi:putative pumilio homolog 7, chloroplastic [Vicia villosa]|uniref:putative pumilio homolog 7, chloroplastic n=1 Tax=Vicia villosa TaxID=3911 RepID=UPI00273CDCEE|nr:putative pumilio homolog 7, chloroplastic [Vicia villosa]